jgi:hypothetical protein
MPSCPARSVAHCQTVFLSPGSYVQIPSHLHICLSPVHNQGYDGWPETGRRQSGIRSHDQDLIQQSASVLSDSVREPCSVLAERGEHNHGEQPARSTRSMLVTDCMYARASMCQLQLLVLLCHMVYDRGHCDESAVIQGAGGDTSARSQIKTGRSSLAMAVKIRPVPA